MILLDTNALIWVYRRHSRAAALAGRGRLYISPASVLELQIVIESGGFRLGGEATVMEMIRADERWVLDDPPSAAWFEEAVGVGWTRDPFDRLLVAHARMRRWPIATSDQRMIAQLRKDEFVEL